MTELAAEALLAAVHRSKEDASATDVVAMAREFYGFLTNPGGATGALAAPVVAPLAPEMLGASPLENGMPVDPNPAPMAPPVSDPAPADPAPADAPPVDAGSTAPEAVAAPPSDNNPQGPATITPPDVTPEAAPQ